MLKGTQERKNTQKREKRRLAEVAREYREKGYEVIVGPKPRDLPGSFAAFQPDLIARDENEIVIVEVTSRSNFPSLDYLEAMATEAEADRNVRFELVVTNPRSRKYTPQKSRMLKPLEIEQRLREIQSLLRSGQTEAAMLLCWATAEATLRLVAASRDISVDNLNSLSLVKESFSVGILNKSEFRDFSRGADVRNSLTHGFRPRGISEALIGRMVLSIEHLISRL